MSQKQDYFDAGIEKELVDEEKELEDNIDSSLEYYEVNANEYGSKKLYGESFVMEEVVGIRESGNSIIFLIYIEDEDSIYTMGFGLNDYNIVKEFLVSNDVSIESPEDLVGKKIPVYIETSCDGYCKRYYTVKNNLEFTDWMHKKLYSEKFVREYSALEKYGVFVSRLSYVMLIVSQIASLIVIPKLGAILLLITLMYGVIDYSINKLDEIHTRNAIELHNNPAYKKDTVELDSNN